LLGAEVIVLADSVGDGIQQARLAMIRQLIAEQPDAYWTRQYDSDGNWLAYARLAEHLIRVIGRVDWLVGCVGTGGSLCGTGHFLRSTFPQLRIAAVDTHRSVLFGQPAGRRLLRGLGNSVLPANLRHEMIDEVHWVGAFPAWQQCHQLLRQHGLFVGPTSGAAGLVGAWIARSNPAARVAVIMPDEGSRYSETVFSDAWLKHHENWNDAVLQPRAVTTISPGSESDWMSFAWGRRSYAEVMRTSGPDL
jgi:cysteine synthase